MQMVQTEGIHVFSKTNTGRAEDFNVYAKRRKGHELKFRVYSKDGAD
jgi:hypothetical protein